MSDEDFSGQQAMGLAMARHLAILYDILLREGVISPDAGEAALKRLPARGREKVTDALTDAVRQVIESHLRQPER